MNVRFVVLVTLAILGGSSAACTKKTWRKWPHCIVNRDVTQPTQSGTDELFDVILGLVNKAPKGILGSELADATQKVKELGDSLAGTASEEDVASVIKEVTDALGGDSAISALFDDDLRYGDKILNKGLSLLKGLVDKGRELRASGKSIDHVLVAISKTASALNSTVKNIAEIVDYEKSRTHETVEAGEGTDDVLIFADNQQPENDKDYLRRDAENDRGPEAVFDLILETLKSASKGITSSQLASAARTIIKDSDALSRDASGQDVDNVIKEIAESINSSAIIASLFDDDLNFDAKVINDALELWNGLAERGLELSKSNKPTGHVMAAISKTAKVIEAVLRDIDEIVNYEESQNPNKGTTGELNKDVLLISGDGNENATSQETANKIEKRGICLSWRWKGWIRVCVRWG